MYINFWYAMEESKNLTAEEPIKIRRLNQDFALWRDSEGKAHCVHDVCVHRGGSLGKGKIYDNCVQCPYHGWRFNGQGDCEYIPSLGKDNQKIPQRAKVDAYPTQEIDGVIFAFLGDLPEEERPPLMHAGRNFEGMEYDPKKWRFTAMGWDVESNYERCVENGIDPSHNEFVHPSHGHGAQNLDEYSVPSYDVKHHEWGQGFWVDFNARAPREGSVVSQSGSEGGKLKVGTGHNGPNSVYTYIHITSENWAHQYLYETPVNSKLTRAINVSMVNFVDDDTPDEDINAMNEYIASQDVVVLNEIEPKVTPSSAKLEVMTPSDKCVVEYRRWLKKWDQKGWRIDHKKVEAELGEVVYAIPSPRRRTEKGWVFPTVPLIPGTEDEAAE